MDFYIREAVDELDGEIFSRGYELPFAYSVWEARNFLYSQIWKAIYNLNLHVCEALDDFHASAELNPFAIAVLRYICGEGRGREC